MNFSFYSGAVGASAMQSRLDVISNNIANINTVGFKSRNGIFADLVYNNMNGQAGQGNLLYGAGSRLSKDDTNFAQGSFETTGYDLDFAIEGEGFFALYDPALEETSYTRDGGFQLSRQADGTFYLTDDNGRWVLDQYGEPIVVNGSQESYPIGVYIFAQKNGLVNLGDNRFQPSAKNGEPTAVSGEGILVQGALESSNVDLGREMARIIDTQRIYQLSLRMVQTSDEIENTINSLRG